MSCRPLTGLRGGQELEASGGSTGSGPHPKGDSADETGVVCQGSGELGSATCGGLGGMQGGQELRASGGSAGSGSQPLGDSLEETGEVCQGPGGLASASRWCLWLLHGSLPQLRGDPEEEEDTGGGLPGPRGVRWAALCIALALPSTAGLPGAGSLGGLAWFGAPAQGRPRQRQRAGLPGTRKAAIWEQTVARWAARLAGGGGVGGLPRLCVPARGRLPGRDWGRQPGPRWAGLCVPLVPLAAARVPTGFPGVCAPAQVRPRGRGRHRGDLPGNGNTRPPDLPLEKQVCRSGSNS